MKRAWMIVIALVLATVHSAVAAGLAGLWEAKNRFGPDVRGRLTIEREGETWRGEIAGQSAVATVTGKKLELTVPGGLFLGTIDPARERITGFWIQPKTVSSGSRYASPVVLKKSDGPRWSGTVTPLDDAMTIYLDIRPRADGALGTFLRNPERNLGRFVDVDRIEQEGDAIRLLSMAGKVLIEGVRRDDDTLSLYVERGNGTYDFHRVGPGDASDFYSRGRPGSRYVYAPPPQRNDGWSVATVEDVGISRDAIGRFIQMIIDTPVDSVHAQDVHGVLIARHGKLVVEEYFHGENRDKPHDTRSAAKVVASTLVGAAKQAGVPIDGSTPVYAAMNGGNFPPDLDARKRALTLAHLMTMSSGLDCDDNDPNSPGNEDTMQDQTEQPDFYRYTLDLRMIRDPGQKAVYCSVNPNLAGGVLARVAHRSLPELFRDLVAEPLQIQSYWMNLTPTGDAYMGGGVRFLPRDFVKLAQLHLNDGTWHGRRVLSADWARRATSGLVELQGSRYGYLWWLAEYPYEGRTVRAFFAGGNGGQIALAIPDLDLVIGFFGGNYSDSVLVVPQRDYVPKYILPAITGGSPKR